MSHILEKIQAMNQIDGGLEALQESLRSCGETGFSEEGRQTCRKQLAEIDVEEAGGFLIECIESRFKFVNNLRICRICR